MENWAAAFLTTLATPAGLRLRARYRLVLTYS